MNERADPSPGAAALRELVMPVVVVAASNGSETACATSTTSYVSVQPAVVSVALTPASRTARMVSETGQFSVSVLTVGQADLAYRAGRPSTEPDKLAAAGIAPEYPAGRDSPRRRTGGEPARCQRRVGRAVVHGHRHRRGGRSPSVLRPGERVPRRQRKARRESRAPACCSGISAATWAPGRRSRRRRRTGTRFDRGSPRPAAVVLARARESAPEAAKPRDRSGENLEFSIDRAPLYRVALYRATV